MLRDLWLRGESRAGKALVRPRPVRTLPLVHSLHSSTICRQPTSWQRASPVGHTHTCLSRRPEQPRRLRCLRSRGVALRHHTAKSQPRRWSPRFPRSRRGQGPPILRWVQQPRSNSWQREEAGRCGRAARSLGAGAPAREERAVCCRELGTLDPPGGRHEHQCDSKDRSDTRGGRGRQR